jgi:hypothetical protein
MVPVSLFVELLRTRPMVLFWTMAVLQVMLWTLVPVLFYSAPPGQLPMVLAVGHEFQFGSEFGPPLAFLLADLVFRFAGVAGVYLLSQLCIVVTFWAVMALGRAVVGATHAVIAVLLMAGVAVYLLPTVEFGPAILATPLWALILFHFWQTIDGGRWFNWIALGFEAGLLLLTSHAGLLLVGSLGLYALGRRFGRERIVDTVGPWIAGIVAVVVLFPYLIWLDLSGPVRLLDLAAIIDNLRGYGWLLAALLAAHFGLGILVMLGRGYVVPSRGTRPEIIRAPAKMGARGFAYFFALVPALVMTLFALIARRPDNLVAAPLAVMSGLAVVMAAGERVKLAHQYLIGYVWAILLIAPPLLVGLAIMIQPWIFAIDLQVNRPTAEIGRFLGDNFQRRTGRPLAVVAGDPVLAAPVAMSAPNRPSLYLESTPGFLPAITKAQVIEKGAVVLWFANDTGGRPPPEIVRQFPDLVPEVPQAFLRRFQGRMEPMRVGWGMIRPATQSGAHQP